MLNEVDKAMIRVYTTLGMMDTAYNELTAKYQKLQAELEEAKAKVKSLEAPKE